MEKSDSRMDNYIKQDDIKQNVKLNNEVLYTLKNNNNK